MIPNRPITRRDGLALTTTSALGMLASGPAIAEEARGDLIDAHVHVWTPDTKKFPLAAGYQQADMKPASFTPRELMAHAKPVGVGRVVLIQMSFYGTDNAYMLQTMHENPGVYAGVAVVNEDTRPAQRMKTLAKRGVVGFRIRPGKRKPETWLQGPGMRAMWRCGGDEGLLMCHLINPEYLPSVARMCRQFPRTPVVIDHFARIGIDGTIRPSDLENLCRLADFPQVTIKVSAYYALGKKKAPYADLGGMIRRLRDVYGANRLMWASDCPFQVEAPHSYKASIGLIQHGLDFLTPDDKQWILTKTAARVFFRKPKQG